jgi:endoglucanase
MDSNQYDYQVCNCFSETRNYSIDEQFPVTWADHFTSDAPSYTIDPTWLQRVSDVVDMITSNGLYVIVNAHHDSYTWLDPTAANANLTMMEDKFYHLWYQIGTMLGCKSNLLAFEALNEPSGSSSLDAAFLTSLQTTFIKAINDAGGFNSKRVIVLGGLGDGIAPAVQYFQRPASNVTNPWAFTYHYYSPCESEDT